MSNVSLGIEPCPACDGEVNVLVEPTDLHWERDTAAATVVCPHCGAEVTWPVYAEIEYRLGFRAEVTPPPPVSEVAV